MNPFQQVPLRQLLTKSGNENLGDEDCNKLILSGFHEAALASFGVQQHVYPEKKVRLQYTTTSPIMHKRLGVED